MLTLQDLTFSYRKKANPVIENINLSIEPGKIYGLLGPNGAGKSTLLYLIMGMLTPVNGRVMFKGVNTRSRMPETMSDIFIVPEEFDLPTITLEQYVTLNAQYYPRFSMKELHGHLETFGLEKNPNLGALSMGQKKKVFMAFALACNTSLLLMDEPTNGLDIPGKSAFRSFIASCMNDDRTIIISTHQVHDIENLVDSVVIMDMHHILLESSLMDLSQKLAFMVTQSPEIIGKALYATPVIGGTSVVIPNDGTYDTNVNIESLFQFVLKNPQYFLQIANKE
ncbi:MAG: ABC transporter ATP-binding protein [Muribaculaceae bacterium]|nr:ABC transporter ATP-binding protein [Muribaculaceae bacterium]